MRKLLLASCFGAAALFTAGYAAANEELTKLSADPQPMGHAHPKFRQYALFRTQADQHRERPQARAGLDVLDRRFARSRRRPARDRRRDVCSCAVPEHRLCARPQQRRQDPLEIRAQAGSERHPRDVLRHRQSRPRLRRRQDLPASGGHHPRRARRQDRRGRLVGEGRRSVEGPDRHRRAVRLQGQGVHRRFRRRVRRARLD